MSCADCGRSHWLKAWDVAVGEWLIVEGESETFAVTVYAVHLDGRLVDVSGFVLLVNAGATRVALRRRDER